MSYTKGPWHASGNGIHTETGSCVALTHQEPREQRQIDARLIAAAPDLLEACQIANQYIAEMLPYPDDRNQEVWLKIRDAIRKATAERTAAGLRLP